MQYGAGARIAALHGAVVGGGLELASACHIPGGRRTTFYALPGVRAASSWAAAAVRIPRLIGWRA